MQTFRKLPMTAPMRNTKANQNMSCMKIYESRLRCVENGHVALDYKYSTCNFLWVVFLCGQLLNDRIGNLLRRSRDGRHNHTGYFAIERLSYPQQLFNLGHAAAGKVRSALGCRGILFD